MDAKTVGHASFLPWKQVRYLLYNPTQLGNRTSAISTGDSTASVQHRVDATHRSAAGAQTCWIAELNLRQVRHNPHGERCNALCVHRSYHCRSNEVRPDGRQAQLTWRPDVII